MNIVKDNPKFLYSENLRLERENSELRFELKALKRQFKKYNKEHLMLHNHEIYNMAAGQERGE